MVIISIRHAAVQMQGPSSANPTQSVEAFGIARFLGVEVDGASSLGKSLPGFQANIEIDQSIVAHMIVPHKLMQSQSVG